MKRSLMVFAAISAFVIPALAPVAVLAQDISDRGQEDLARSPRRDGGRPGNREETADSGGVRERPGRDASGDRQAPSPPPQDTTPRRDSGGGDRDRGKRGGNDGNAMVNGLFGIALLEKLSGRSFVVKDGASGSANSL